MGQAGRRDDGCAPREARRAAGLPADGALNEALVRHCADIIAVRDAAGARRYVSPAVERVLGYRPEELVGADAVAPVHPDDAERVRAAWAACLAAPGAQAGVTYRARHRDGTWRVLEGTCTNLLHDPAVGGVVINARDVTGRRAAEDARRAAEGRYRALVEQLPAAVYLNPIGDGAVARYISPQWAALTGYSPEEWLADPELGRARLDSDDRARVLAAGARSAATGAPFAEEYRYRRKDGTAVWIRDEAVVVRDEAGLPQCWQGLLLDITARKAAEAALRASEARLRTQYWAFPLPTYTWQRRGDDFVFLDYNAAAFAFAGDALAARLGQPASAIYRELPAVAEHLARCFAERATLRQGLRYAGMELIVTYVPVAPDLVVMHTEDDTERRRARAALEASEARFRALVQRASDAVAILGPDGTIAYQSPAVERILGHAPEDMVGTSAFAWIHPDDLPRVRAALTSALAAPAQPVAVEARARHADGAWRWLEATGTNLLDEPSVGGLVVNYRDVTERRAFEERLRHQALHDPLTGLPNRALFMDRLAQALERARRDAAPCAVLFLDLDRFKDVNDGLGHEAGDRLLVAVAERLRAHVRPGDTLARLGGDEFVLLVEAVGDLGAALKVADRLHGALAAPFALGDRDVVVATSIGIALGADDRPEDLLRFADVALYRAKGAGRGGYEVFYPGMSAGALERLALEADLWRAIGRGELRVHYQPLVALAEGRVVGVEALLRWQHPERGLVPPGAFIPVAEETGLILPIGRWVLGEACRQAREWQEAYPLAPPLTVSVNLSPRQFRHPDLADSVADALARAGVAPGRVQLEITESAVMGDAAAAAATLRRLKGLGVRLALDDFGTGYSSLAYLRRFPLDALKVDKSFVAGLGADPSDTAIVRAIVDLAHTLGLAVTAEGVETAAQAAELRALGCEHGQGYHFAPPLDPEALGARLAAG